MRGRDGVGSEGVEVDGCGVEVDGWGVEVDDSGVELAVSGVGSAPKSASSSRLSIQTAHIPSSALTSLFTIPSLTPSNPPTIVRALSGSSLAAPVL